MLINLMTKKLKNIILTVALIVLATGCYSEKVLSVSLLISRNDSVQLKNILLEDAYATKYMPPGEYILQITDDSKEIYSTPINVVFYLMSDPPQSLDPVAADIRIPYRSDMRRLILYKNTTKIYETDINLCNNDGACGIGYETHMSCQSDCPQDKIDGVCVKDADGICDPDCATGADPDCAEKGGAQNTGQWLYLLLVLMVFLAVSLLFYKRKKGI